MQKEKANIGYHKVVTVFAFLSLLFFSAMTLASDVHCDLPTKNTTSISINILDPLLISSIHKCDAKKVVEYLDQGANVNSVYSDTETILGYSARLGYVDIVNILLEKGAQVDKTVSTHHFTPLMNAITNQHVETVKTLIEHGANVNHVTPEAPIEGFNHYGGFTPLMCATSGWGHIKNPEKVRGQIGQIVEMLLKKEANVNARVCSDSRRFDINAAKYIGEPIYVCDSPIVGDFSVCCPEIAVMLLYSGADVNQVRQHVRQLIISFEKLDQPGFSSRPHILEGGAIDVFVDYRCGPRPNAIIKQRSWEQPWSEEILKGYHHGLEEYVKERAAETGLTLEDAREIIEELKKEDGIAKNIEMLSSYHQEKEIPIEEFIETLSGKIPVKDEVKNEIGFIELNGEDDITLELELCEDDKWFKKEQIKDEWRELIADTGELVISFLPVAGPPISVAFSQLVIGDFDAKGLLEGFGLGVADFVGVGFLKKVKNIEKFAALSSKIALKVKISKSVGWKVGEDYYKLTSKGTEPFWSTVKNRFWKNKAATLTPDEIGELEKLRPGNVERMKQGKPPQKYSNKKFDRYGGDGLESKELHHTPTPKRAGGKDIVDLWPEEHAAADPSRHLGY